MDWHSGILARASALGGPQSDVWAHSHHTKPAHTPWNWGILQKQTVGSRTVKERPQETAGGSWVLSIPSLRTTSPFLVLGRHHRTRKEGKQGRKRGSGWGSSLEAGTLPGAWKQGHGLRHSQLRPEQTSRPVCWGRPLYGTRSSPSGGEPGRGGHRCAQIFLWEKTGPRHSREGGEEAFLE